MPHSSKRAEGTEALLQRRRGPKVANLFKGSSRGKELRVAGKSSLDWTLSDIFMVESLSIPLAPRLSLF